MATFTEFNLKAGQEAERKLRKTWVNVAKDNLTKEWEVVGVGVEDSTIELNPDIATNTDILGTTITKINKTEPAQSFEPNTVRGGSKLAFILWDMTRRNALSEFTNFEVMITDEFVGSGTTGFAAEVHTGCTIIPQSIGGSAQVDMPINIQFSNKKELGTVKFADGVPTFTKDGAI